MAEEITTTETAPVENNDGALTETEIKAIVGEAVDEKLQPYKGGLEKIAGLDMDAFKGSIIEDVGKLIGERSGTVDEGKLTETIGALLDNKLKGIGVTVTKKSGPLSRFLGI